MREIEGVYVANVTPFRDDDSLAVDEEAYVEHVSWLAEKGVRGVVPFGTNGEGPSVTLGEKLRVLEGLFEREFPIQIIPAVMQNNLPETLEMLRALEDYPATAVLVLPPYYFKPVEPEGLVRFYEAALGATGHDHRLPHPQVRRPHARAGRERTSRLGRQGLRRGGRLRRGRSQAGRACSSGRRMICGGGSVPGLRV